MKSACRLIIASIVMLATNGNARIPTTAKSLFQCSFGAKQVSVTAGAHGLTYTYGAPNKPELTVTGAPASGTVQYHRELFPHAEHQQLRFRRGAYSYVIFNRWASPDYQGQGAEDKSGLLVIEGGRVMQRRDCKAGGEFLDSSEGFDWSSLPDDPKDVVPDS